MKVFYETLGPQARYKFEAKTKNKRNGRFINAFANTKKEAAQELRKQFSKMRARTKRGNVYIKTQFKFDIGKL
jgi:hypothetical protein